MTPPLAALALMPLVSQSAAPGMAPPNLSISEELHVSRAASEHEWPFSVARGDLVCGAVAGQRVVIFTEAGDGGEETVAEAMARRSVVVSANPMALLGSYEDRALYAPYDTLETLIRRLAPFEAMGTRLCDGPQRYP